MASVPQLTILAKLEDEYGVRLMRPETIETCDLQDLWAIIEDQHKIIEYGRLPSRKGGVSTCDI
jgi:hypothetical protein